MKSAHSQTPPMPARNKPINPTLGPCKGMDNEIYTSNEQGEGERKRQDESNHARVAVFHLISFLVRIRERPRTLRARPHHAGRCNKACCSSASGRPRLSKSGGGSGH